MMHGKVLLTQFVLFCNSFTHIVRRLALAQDAHTLRSAYTGRLPADLSHATRMNMGKSSVIV